MNRLQAAKELRSNREGLPIPFEGLEASFEIRPIWIPSWIEYDEVSEQPKRFHRNRFAILFRQEHAIKPNGLVRTANWKQILGLLRRNYQR